MGDFKISSGTTIFVLILIGIIVIMWVSSLECKNNSECNENEICTVNHICYKPLIPEKTIYITENKYTTASLILGICFIIAAIILRKKDFKFLKKKL